MSVVVVHHDGDAGDAGVGEIDGAVAVEVAVLVPASNRPTGVG